MKTLWISAVVNGETIQRKPIIEIEIVDSPPEIDSGGWLEIKNGEHCLRRGDRVERLEGGKYSVERTWLPPLGEPWNRHLYRTKSK